MPSYRKLKASPWAAITYSMRNTSVSSFVFQRHLAAYYNLHHSAFAAAGWDIHTVVSLKYYSISSKAFELGFLIDQRLSPSTDYCLPR